MATIDSEPAAAPARHLWQPPVNDGDAPLPRLLPIIPVQDPALRGPTEPTYPHVEAPVAHYQTLIDLELGQWEADARSTVANVVTEAVNHLDDGASPLQVAYTLAHTAVKAPPDRVATGFGWAVLALAEQARAARS